VPAVELHELAGRLDELVDGHLRGGYRAEHIGRLLKNLRHPGGSVGDVLQLVAGRTQVLQAPTGFGKTVLMEAIACLAAMRGLTVTLVVPTNNDVVQLTRAVERDLALLGSTA
jgi:Rad3-related DNA helicase